MQQNLATTHHCPQCGSIDIIIRCFGMPLPSFGRYVSAYEELSRAITMAAISFDEEEAFGVNLSDDDDFFSWYCPEEGRGMYAPGNAYNHGGCVIDDFDFDEGSPCTCRSCGVQFADFTFDDDFNEDNDSVQEPPAAQE